MELVKNRSFPQPKFANGFYYFLMLLMQVSSAKGNVPNISTNEKVSIVVILAFFKIKRKLKKDQYHSDADLFLFLKERMWIHQF